jgi:hypothetical protein
VKVFVRRFVIGVTAVRGLPKLSLFVGSIEEVQIVCSPVVLAPDRAGALAGDGAFVQVGPIDGAGVVLVFVPSIRLGEIDVLVFVPSIRLGEISFSGRAVGKS